MSRRSPTLIHRQVGSVTCQLLAWAAAACRPGWVARRWAWVEAFAA